MKCKKCGGKTQVTDTEESLDGFVVMRRRQCPACGYRFKTTETYVSITFSSGIKQEPVRAISTMTFLRDWTGGKNER